MVPHPIPPPVPMILAFLLVILKGLQGIFNQSVDISHELLEREINPMLFVNADVEAELHYSLFSAAQSIDWTRLDLAKYKNQRKHTIETTTPLMMPLTISDVREFRKVRAEIQDGEGQIA